MHHKLLDHGAFRISVDYRLFVSNRVNGTAGVEEWLFSYDGEEVRRPRQTLYEIRPEFIQWHVSEVWKGDLVSV